METDSAPPIISIAESSDGVRWNMKKNRRIRALTREELKSAALIVFRNAEELLADAELLHYAKRYPRAIFLACIGIEELGKACLTLELFSQQAASNAADRWEEFWRFWTHHQSKAAHGEGFLALNPDILEREARDLLPDGYPNWRAYEYEKVNVFAQTSQTLVRVKEQSLYVDFLDRDADCKPSGFTLPSVTIKESHSESFCRRLSERLVRTRFEIDKLGWLHLPPYPPDDSENYT